VEFVDLKEQYRRYQVEVDERIRRVLAHGHFIMGPEIGELEWALASYVASGTALLSRAARPALRLRCGHWG
jgi:UDP-2-acetamido-2-deoxy-ribo-hexuluronate aminotransferase